MPQVWKGQYHHLKVCGRELCSSPSSILTHLYITEQAHCSELLLLLGHTQTAFTLCSEHAYCDGLMESTYREPQALLPRLEDTLRRVGGQCGTDSMPLATACFLWLEERNRPADILSLGLTDKPLLEAFLSVSTYFVCPLSWPGAWCGNWVIFRVRWFRPALRWRGCITCAARTTAPPPSRRRTAPTM